MSRLREQGVRAFFWDFLGKILTQGAGFIVTIILARLLAPSDFGLVAMIMVIVGIASIFTDMGLGSALIQRESLVSVHYSSVFYFNIVVGTALSIITYLSAGAIAQFYRLDALVPIVQVLSPLFVINSFSSTQTTKLRRELNYSVLARVRFLSSVASGLIGIVLAMNGWGVWSLVTQSLAMGLLYNCLIWFWSGWRPRVEFSTDSLRELWSFGFHMFLAGLLQNMVARVDYLVIGRLFTPATLGFYERAKSFNRAIVHNSSSSLMAVLFPVLSKIQSDIPRLTGIVLNLLSVLSFSTFFLVGALFVVSDEIIVLLFGMKWQPSVMYFKILILSSFSFPISSLLVNVLRSRGKSRKFLGLEVIKKSLVIANLGVLYVFGIDSYLYGLIIVSTLVVSINLIFACRELKVGVWAAAAPVLVQALIALISVASVLFIDPLIEHGALLEMLVKGGAFVVLYVAISFMCNTRGYRAFREQLGKVGRKNQTV